MIDFTPLLGKPKKPMGELYPFLDEIPGIVDFTHHDKERVLHYMLLAYHPQSPLIEKYTDVNQRKAKAAEYAGYKLTIPRDIRMRDMLFDHSDDRFVEMLHHFLVFVNNRLWSMIVANECTFNEYQKKLITPLSIDIGKDKEALTAATIKGKLMEDMDNINSRLETYYNRFYMGDEKLVTAGTKRKGISPESVANHVSQV